MNKQLFESPIVSIGTFTANSQDSCFYQSCVSPEPIFVFPKNSIIIKHESKSEFVADNSLVNFYNKDQIYSKKSINMQGDDCFWFNLSLDILCEILKVKQPETNVFNFQYLTSDNDSFIQFLNIIKKVLSNQIYSDMQIEELSIDLLHSLIIKNANTKEINNFRAYEAQKKIVENVKASLQENLGKNVSLIDLSRDNYTSPFHLSRIFKKHCGYGLNKYRQQQRLRGVAYNLTRGDCLLKNLAFDFGFSSQSHLSASFKMYYGCTPTQLLESPRSN